MKLGYYFNFVKAMREQKFNVSYTELDVRSRQRETQLLVILNS
jgi:hypothetical protein